MFFESPIPSRPVVIAWTGLDSVERRTMGVQKGVVLGPPKPRAQWRPDAIFSGTIFPQKISGSNRVVDIGRTSTQVCHEPVMVDRRLDGGCADQHFFRITVRDVVGIFVKIWLAHLQHTFGLAPTCVPEQKLAVGHLDFFVLSASKSRDCAARFAKSRRASSIGWVGEQNAPQGFASLAKVPFVIEYITTSSNSLAITTR